MRDCTYAGELADGKLMLVLFVRRIKTLLFSAVIGSLLFGAIYIVYNTFIKGDSGYKATSSYEIVYDVDPTTQNGYTYINEQTWNSLIKMDAFYEILKEEGGMNAYERDDLLSMISATLPSDVRIPQTHVICSDAKECKRIALAVENAFIKFGEVKHEIVEIHLLDSTNPIKENPTPRIPQAFILGAITGAVLGIFIMIFVFFWSESAWVAETIERRFKIKALVVTCVGDTKINDRDKANVNAVCGANSTAVLPCDDYTDIAELTDMLKASGVNATGMPSVNLVSECAETLRKYDKVLLVTEAGEQNGARVERILSNLDTQGIKVDGFILNRTDKAIVSMYYFGRKKKDI